MILNKKETINKIKNAELDFVWINTYSDLKLRRLNEYINSDNELDTDIEDLIEAKFFNKHIEISVMNENDDCFSVREFKPKDRDYIEESQILNNHKSPYNTENSVLVIRHYLGVDEEDGQAYTEYTKLHDVVRGESN